MVASIGVELGATIELGATPYGTRRIYPASGGSANGMLSADALAGGLEWELTLPSGAREIEERQVLRADDGSLIYLRASPSHLLAAKCRGVAPPAVEQILDEQFVATIERLRALLNGGSDADIPPRAVRNLLADLADGLEAAIGEQHAKMTRKRTFLSPALVVVWSIGLALAKGIVEMHSGSITARSEGAGRGCEFIVRLPCLSGDPAGDRSHC